jgi:hypothetical protein
MSENKGPIANYVYKPWKNRPGTEVGYTAVGPGWVPILRSLDSLMSWAIEGARINSRARKEYQDPDCTDEATITVVQIKEKFGGLRVYWESEGLGERLRQTVHGACIMAESLSFKICEKCGTLENVETAMRPGKKYSRTLTLCATCRQKWAETGVINLGGSKV